MKIEFKSDLIINQGVGFIAKYSIGMFLTLCYGSVVCLCLL